MKAHTLEDKSYHPEIEDFAGHRDAIEQPAVIAPDQGTRVYLGKPWQPGDPAMAPLQRKIVTAFDSRRIEARIITAYNESVTTASKGLGAPIYKDETPPPEEI